MNRSLIASACAGALAALVLAAGSAAGQYQPIPNFSGVGAGFNFRQAINQRFSGAQAISPTIVSLPFASLPVEQDGMLLWCRDCQKTTPCSGGGAGAMAVGTRGAWACAGGPLEQDLNANGRNLAGAASVQASLAGDAQAREALVAGGGVRVSNGSTPPYTVIDENANISGHVNGVINVKAPPYGAKGDCTTDDTAAIQSAINAACAVNPSNQENIPPVYLPPTPYPGCYRITAPLLIDCSDLHVFGGGRMNTVLMPIFYGPDLIVQSAPTSNPPLASSVTATWQANHAYPQFSELRDSNGNIEVATGGGTSGSGSHPTWPTTQGATVADGSVTWTLEVIGSQLASGTGSAYDTVNNSAPVLDLGWTGPPMNLSGLSAFTVETYLDAVGSSFCGNNYCNIIGSYVNAPGSGAAGNVGGGAFDLYVNPFSTPANELQADIKIGGTHYGLSDTASLTTNVTHHIALTYDGSTVRLFKDGVMVASTAASGTLTQGYYETVMFPGLTPLGTALWPGNNPGAAGHGFVNGYYDSVRISNSARYTANFTRPTAKFAVDGNSLLLLNFGASPAGTVIGNTNSLLANTRLDAFFPIEVGSFMNRIHLDNLEYCPGGSGGGGLWAVWAVNSRFEDLHCSFQSEIAVELWDNDFQDTLRNIFAFGGNGRTNYGFVFANQSNGNDYNRLQCDGQTGGCIIQQGSSGSYELPIFTDRGSYIYPLIIGGRAVLRDPFSDMESANSLFLADVLALNSWAPIVIHGGELDTPNASGAHFAINGGQPISDVGTSLGGTASAEIVNVISNPTSPVTIRDAVLPSGVPLTNPGKLAQVYANVGGSVSGLTVSTGIKFASLPAPVVNGASFYCPDCDPPANPPTACTSSGAKSGAWVHGINSTWICAP
jgi:hypothetical protein